MRVGPGLIVLIAVAAMAITQPTRARLTYGGNARVAPKCIRESLTIKEGETDAAMGGVRATDFILTNKSISACTLEGYPRVELLNRKGLTARRATQSEQLPTDREKMPPQLVTLAPGKTAWFRLYCNAGGAGYLGKPCPVYPKIKIVAPGTTTAFVLRSDIQSCPQTEFQVSAVRSGTPQ